MLFLQALERLSFGDSRIRNTVIAQSRILLFFYCTTYVLLEKNKPKYQKLETLPPDQVPQSPTFEAVELDSSEKFLEPELPEAAVFDSSEKFLEPELPEEQLELKKEVPEVDQILPFILEGL